MWFALLIMAVGLANLALGFASAGYLGWGPRSWDEVQLSLMPAIRPEKLQKVKSPYVSELDLQRLLDRAQQRMRKLSSSKSTIEDELQSKFLEFNSQLERLEIRLDCLHSRLLANEFAVGRVDWQAVVESTRLDLKESTEVTVKLLEEWGQTLASEKLERFGPFQIGLCDEFSRITDSMPAIASRAELDDTDREALLLWYHGSSVELSQISWQVRSLMREILGESRPAIEWDPQLMKDRGHGMQTLAALDAERRLNASAETNYFIARCCLDQEVSWVPQTGRLLFRFAAERLADVISPRLPGHWLVVPLGQGQWVVRGDADVVDEFVSELDKVRQLLSKTELRVGESSFNLTTSWIVSLDSSEVNTETLLLALRKSMLDAHKYGGDRTFLCEEGQPIPVLPVHFDVEPTTVEL